MKRNLNSDGQQFININKQTIASCLKSLNIKMTTTYGIGNPGPGFGQAQTYGGVKLANGIPTLPLLKIDNTDIKKKKNEPIHFQLKRPHTSTEMNENKHGQYNSMVSIYS
jgi:hypothetical protein